MKKLLRTVDSFGPTILRLVLGGVILMHGLQKTMGLFGGSGFEGTMKMFTENMKIPYGLAMAAIVTESVGSACLILGFLTRIWALGMVILMGIAVYKVHFANGFFMNWMGNQKGEGYEYHILVIGMALALLALGGGKASLDAGMSGSSRREPKSDKIKA
jgi:putative oxidoreductase